VKQILNIFGVVKGRRGSRRFRGFLLVTWFSRVDAFPDAEFSEIRQADLKFSHGLRSRDEVLGLARDSLLLNLAHCRGLWW